MDFSNHKFRCHSLYHLMTGDPGKLSKGAMIHLVDVYSSTKYKRTKDIKSKYFEKGLAVEEKNISLYSEYKGELYFKNTVKLENDWIIGTPDIRTNVYVGIKSPRLVHKRVIDVKSSWDVHTFNRHLLDEKPEPAYFWQGQGYMFLEDAEDYILAYGLINTPEFIIDKEVRRLKYELPGSQLEEAEQELRRTMIFDDIPLKERVIEQYFRRDEKAIAGIKVKVELAREFLNHLNKKQCK